MRAAALILGVFLAIAPAAAQEKVWRVGYLTGGSAVAMPEAPSTWRGALLQVLAQNGFVLGRNLELVARYADLDLGRLPILAREIDAARVDVVVAISDLAVVAMRAAAPSTAIVGVIGDASADLIDSLARPGGRVTGMILLGPEGDAKRLQLLAEAMPHARRFAYLARANAPPERAVLLHRTAAQLGVELTTYEVADADEHSAAFAAMRKDGQAGVVIGAYQVLASDRRVPALAIEHAMPSVCEWEYMALLGCMLGFGSDLAFLHRRVGEYTARILKGADPAALPAERAETFKLTVNLGTAARLGLDLPASLVARADEVIE